MVRWHGRLPPPPAWAGRPRPRQRPADLAPLRIPPQTQARIIVLPTPSERRPPAPGPEAPPTPRDDATSTPTAWLPPLAPPALGARGLALEAQVARLLAVAASHDLLALRALLVNRLVFRGTAPDARWLALREASRRLHSRVSDADLANGRALAHADAREVLEATLAALAGAEPPRGAGRPAGLGWALEFLPPPRRQPAWAGPSRPPWDPDRSWRDGPQARHGWAEAQLTWRLGLARITRVETLTAVYDLVGQAQRERLAGRAELGATLPDSPLLLRLVDDAAGSAQRLDLHLQALRSPQLWPGLRQLFAIAASRSGPACLVPALLPRTPDRALRRLSLWWLEALERSSTQGRQAWLAREPARPLVRHLLSLSRHGRAGAAAQVRRYPDLANHLYRWLNLLGVHAGLAMLSEIKRALPGLSALAEAACREGLAHAALMPPLSGGMARQDWARMGPDSALYRAWGAHPRAGELVLDPVAFHRLQEGLLIRALTEHRPRAAIRGLEELHRLLDVASTDWGAYLQLRSQRQTIAVQAREALERALAGVQVHPPWDEAAQAEAAHLRRSLGRLQSDLITMGSLTARGRALLEG